MSFTAAKAGTLLKPKGTDGAYVFTVTLNDGTSTWYYDAVMYVCENGYMNGVAEGQFNPDGAVTRAQLATMLMRLMES